MAHRTLSLRRGPLWLALLLVCLLPTMLRADILYLKSGGTIEGKVIDAGNSYRVITRDGELLIAKSEVLKIVPSTDPVTVFTARFAAIDPKDPKAVAAYQDLAGWCHANELPTQEQQCDQAVIGIDPENAAARAALGYEKIDGKWLNGDDKMAAKGLVKVKGQWVTPEAKQDIQRTDKLVQAADANETAADDAKQATTDLEQTRQSLQGLIQQAQADTAAAKAAQLAAVQEQQNLQQVRMDAEVARAQALQALLANQEVLRQIQAERRQLEQLQRGGGGGGNRSALPPPASAQPATAGNPGTPAAPGTTGTTGTATH